MKNKKLFGIIAIAALIMVSMVFVSCGPSVSGTYVFDEDSYFLTFKGKNVEGKNGGYALSGTFSVKDKVISIDAKYEDGSAWKRTFEIIDKETLKEQDNSIWKKK
ncbi:MAG: hypothetical protein FWD13_04635 [Treponema sp.]|nr:hypothetical protein [Treponema sp.]